MLKKNMEDALNRQMNRELYSGYLYLSMAAYFESKDLKGFAHWMGSQAQEEYMHGMKFYNHIIQHGGRARMMDIEAPPMKWTSPLKVFEQTLKHEQAVTGLIHDLVELAKKSKDHATTKFLQWFVTEQVEEEEAASEVLERLKSIGKDANALCQLDRELATRPMLWTLPPGKGGGGE
jgi:ferritin